MLQRQFTSTVYIVKNRHFLFIFHKKMQKWLPPGGHLECNELPSEGAIREAFEETGLEIELILQENVWIDPSPNCKSIPRPFLCLCEEIPAYRQEPSHQHIDFIFVGRPIGGSEVWNQEETGQLKWFSLEELQELIVGHDIFPDTLEIAKSILAMVDFEINPLHLIQSR